MGQSAFRSIEKAEVEGKRVLVRVDMNVPMRDGVITDTTRIDRVLPTIRSLVSRGARVVILSHFDRPKGKPVPEMSLRPVAEKMDDLLESASVRFVEDCIGPDVEAIVNSLENGHVVFLENLRFHPGEEANDPSFAAALAALGDVYVNDAFSCAHRAHASTEGLAHLLPALAGRAMTAEIKALSEALSAPERPMMAVVGGAKISSKLAVLNTLVAKVDGLSIGGAMANTFLHARGLDVAESLCEPDMAETARDLLRRAEAAGRELVLPVDAVVADRLARNVRTAAVPVETVPPGRMILDVGPATAELICAKLAESRTLVWNGPLGCFETPPFDAGTNRVAAEAAALTRAGKLFSVAGGGDTLAALAQAGAAEDFSYLSTAGGAFLEWLQGRTLPGVAALEAAAGN